LRIATTSNLSSGSASSLGQESTGSRHDQRSLNASHQAEEKPVIPKISKKLSNKSQNKTENQGEGGNHYPVQLGDGEMLPNEGNEPNDEEGKSVGRAKQGLEIRDGQLPSILTLPQSGQHHEGRKSQKKPSQHFTSY